MGLGALLWVSKLKQGLDQMDAETPANLSNLVMLWVVNNWQALEALS